MKPYEVKVDCSRGAPMGRGCTMDPETDTKLHLRRVPIDSGGYDPGGVYWGIADAKHGVNPLYCAWASCSPRVVCYIRAASRDVAKSHFPNARFYR